MANAKQLVLSKFKEVKKIKKIRKLPQPRVSRFRAVRKFELLYRPFDLRFRGKINKWFAHLRQYDGYDCSRALDKYQGKIVKLYFYPQPPNNRWLTQPEVLDKTGGSSRKKLKAQLVASLFQIWDKTK